jgi:hypothetical protein
MSPHPAERRVWRWAYPSEYRRRRQHCLGFCEADPGNDGGILGRVAAPDPDCPGPSRPRQMGAVHPDGLARAGLIRLWSIWHRRKQECGDTIRRGR